MNINKTNKRAALYARYSSDNQREESIEAQLSILHKFCAENGYTVVAEYCDRAKSATTSNRPEFLRMIDDSKNKEFDFVIVHKLDRFSRDRYDSAFFKRELKRNDVKLISVLERLDDSPESIILESLLEAMAEYYSRNLGREVMKGLGVNAKKCIWNGGTPPLGYDVVEQRLVVNPEEAKAVQLIFEMVADGYGYGAIVDKLNLLGYKTKKGVAFGRNSIYEILRNERYKGVYVFNKRASKHNNHAYKPDEEVVRIEGGCPEIVTKELWERANAVRRASRSSYSNAKRTYLLTGLLYCECGGKFHGNVRRHKQRGLEYTTYRCSERVNKRDCDTKEIRCQILDAWVIDEFCKVFFTEDSIKRITQGLNENLRNTVDNDDDYNRVKDTLSRAEKSRDNLIEAISQTGVNDAITAKIKECEAIIQEAKTFLESYERDYNQNTITEDDVKAKIDEIKEYLLNPENVQRSKFILSQYIEKIEISNEKIKATFKVAFANLEEDSDEEEARAIAEYREEKTVKRKLLIKNYSDVDKSSDIYRIIEKLKSRPSR